MKANFVLPEIEETFFSSIYYTELDPAETQIIVSQYNAEGITMGQKPTAGVISFKTRNEEKRSTKHLAIPGVLWRNKDRKPSPLMKIEREDVKSITMDIKPETKIQLHEGSTRGKSKDRRSKKTRSRGNSPIRKRRSRSRSSGIRRNRSTSRERYRKSRSSERYRRHRSRSRSRSKGSNRERRRHSR